MLICKKCCAVVVDGVCTHCGRKKTSREATEGDQIYVGSGDFILYKMIEDILDEQGIAYVKKGSLGSAVSFYVGDGAETYNFYVLLKDYDAAVAALSQLENEMSEEELNEYIDNYSEEDDGQ